MQEEKDKKLAARFKTGITAIVLVVVAIVMFTGNVKLTFEEDSFTVSAGVSAGSSTVAYADIKETALRDNVTLGRRNFGIGSLRLQAGNFENAEFGEYKLYAYSDTHLYIVVSTDEGTVVFNTKTEDETREVYRELQSHLN